MVRGTKVQKHYQSFINRVTQARGAAPSTEYSINCLNWFVGLGSRNLFPVEGWIMRAFQNAGTGTKLIGMMGASNGVLVNGPTWTDSGITFDRNSSQYIEANIPNQHSPTTDGITLITVSKVTNLPPPNYPNPLQLIGIGGQSPGFIIIAGSNILRASCYTAGTDGAGHFIDGDIFFAGATFKPSTRETFCTWNAAETDFIVPDSFVFNSSLIRMGYAADGSFFSGRTSLNMVFNRVLTPGEIQYIRSLYKSTIGKGLGLP